MNYQQINLYQPMFRKQKKIFSAVTILQSLAVVLVGFVLFYVYASWNVNKLRNEVANHKRMQTEALAKIGTLPVIRCVKRASCWKRKSASSRRKSGPSSRC